jgi:tetratricopeptide (TPR) repeat protein
LGRFAKISIGVVAGLLALTIAGISIGVYYARSYNLGIKLIGAGAAALNRRDYDTAVAKYTAALGTKLNRQGIAMAYGGRGTARNFKTEYHEAIQDFTESIRTFPIADAYSGRGYAYHRKNDLDKAAADYTQAIQLDPNSALALLNRGMIFLFRGQLDRALADLDEAVRVGPNNAEAFAQRGLAYQQKGYLESALASFESALRLDPNHALARAQRASISDPGARTSIPSVMPTPSPLDAQIHDSLFGKTTFYPSPTPSPPPDSFETYLEQETADNLLNQGIAANKNGNPGEAIELFTKALTYHPNFSTKRALLCDRGFAYSNIGEREKAARDYDEAIRFDPGFATAYYNRGINDRDLNQLDKAIADFSEAIRLNPRFVQAYVNRGAAYLRQDKTAKAISDYDMAVAGFDQLELPLGHDVLNSIAWMRATSPIRSIRNGKAAVAEATKACELTQWKNAAYVDTLAAAHAEASDFDQAIKYQTQVLGFDNVRADFRPGMEQRLKLYQRHKPYREETKR